MNIDRERKGVSILLHNVYHLKTTANIMGAPALPPFGFILDILPCMMSFPP